MVTFKLKEHVACIQVVDHFQAETDIFLKCLAQRLLTIDIIFPHILLAEHKALALTLLPKQAQALSRFPTGSSSS